MRPRMPSAAELFGDGEEKSKPADYSDAESFFSLPDAEADDEEDEGR